MHEAKVQPIKMKKEVTLRETDNGFIVSTYGEKGRKEMVANDLDGAYGMMIKMMGKKMKPSDAMKKQRLTSDGYMKR